MPVIGNPLDLIFQNLFFETTGLIETGRLVVKLEGYNVTGSIKIKSALFMLANLERRRVIEPQRSTIVESSSGNIGVALALICSLRGYDFICVTDPNISAANRRAIEAYGGRVIVVDRRDANGGFLETRLACIRELLARNNDHVWLNQYANPANAQAHADWTALEILNEFPNVTHLYVGTGTTGTLTGLAQRFAQASPRTRLIAVEPEGSVTFDAGRAGRRLIPGIGTSRRPELADESLVERIVYVSEADAIAMCHRLARRHGLLLGGSSGSVLAAVIRDAAEFASDSLVVAISADLGDKYLDSVFSPEWVKANYGLAVATLNEGTQTTCEPLQEIIARHDPAAAATPGVPRSSNGHHHHASNGRPSSTR
jgi:N-(2-amino-2-carboxyethyl)-L-glutamate synthase